MPGPYRLHLLGPGDERALDLLASGSGRFGSPGEAASKPTLSAEDAAAFVGDDRTICLVAIEEGSNRIAGFVYACVLFRRHTKLRHLCVYEIGVDLDHRQGDVGATLMQGLAAEARKRGIDQGFVVSSASDSEVLTTFHTAGAVPIPDPVVLALTF